MKFLTKYDIKLKKHKKTSRKGDNGRVLIIGGSEDYVGALALAGLAALRAGCDWVTIAAPKKVAWAVNCLSPDLVTKKFDCEFFNENQADDILKLSKGFDAVLIGNGLGMERQTVNFVKKVVKSIRKPLVIDADGIKAIGLNDVDNAILTPHRGELDILLKNSKIKEKDLQKKLKNNVVLLKGRVDKIITKNRTFYNRTGNEGMSKAGTGDVLAGLCTGFLAQGYTLTQSACYSAYFNGLAGDILLKKRKTYSFIASDLIQDLKKVIHGK